jgi:hypothetical protein
MVGEPRTDVQGGMMIKPSGFDVQSAMNGEAPKCGRKAFLTFPSQAAVLGIGDPNRNGTVSNGAGIYASGGTMITQMKGSTGNETGYHAHYQSGAYAGFNSAGVVQFSSIGGAMTIPDLGFTADPPPAGYGRFFVEADVPYYVNDSGVYYDLTGSGGSDQLTWMGW